MAARSASRRRAGPRLRRSTRPRLPPAAKMKAPSDRAASGPMRMPAMSATSTATSSPPIAARRNNRPDRGALPVATEGRFQRQDPGWGSIKRSYRASHRRRLECCGVVLVEPAQRIGGAVAGPRPFGVARLLRRAVAHMEAELVGARQLLQPGDPRQAKLLVSAQCDGGIFTAGSKTGGGGGGRLS